MRDLETIIILVLPAFNFIPQRYVFSKGWKTQSLGREIEQEDDGSFYQLTIGQENVAKDFADLTPALR